MAAFSPNAAALRDPSAVREQAGLRASGAHEPVGATPRSTSPPAQFLGPWRLVRVLGEGTWNQVFQAAPLDATAASTADYAIKRIKASCINDPQAVAQIRREARLGRLVSNPHLVCVLSAHVESPPYYLVMPYQRGVTLRNVLRARNWLSISQALWITRQIAEAMCAMHDRGWLHNDIKPDNIFIAANGHVTLCDLGLAQPTTRPFGDDESPDEMARRTRSPQENLIVGTPAYMAPESYSAHERLTAASDTYRLGVTLYEMLAGRRPFEHANAEELVAAHRLLKPPDLCGIRSESPASVARLLCRMLAKEPLRRPTGVELIHALVDVEIDLFDDGA